VKLTEINQKPLLMTWLDLGGQRSGIKMTAGHQDGKGSHVDTLASKSIWFATALLLQLPPPLYSQCSFFGFTGFIPLWAKSCLLTEYYR